MTIDEKALLPCPFCGSAAEFIRRGTVRQSAQICCMSCGCAYEGPDETGWNTRALPPSPATAEGWILRRDARQFLDDATASWLPKGVLHDGLAAFDERFPATPAQEG